MTRKETEIYGKRIVVFDDGGMFDVDGNEINQTTSGKYLGISFPGRKRLLAHRVVAHAFLGLDLSRRDIHVHHKNGIRTDNRVANLEVIDGKEHARMHGEKYPHTKICIACGREFEVPVHHRKRTVLCSKECVKTHHKKISMGYKKPVVQYSLDGEYIKTWDGAKEAAEAFGGYGANIAKCCNKEIYSYKGYIWRRVGDTPDGYDYPYIKDDDLRERVRLYKEQNHLSEVRLGELCGMSQSPISSLLRGKRLTKSSLDKIKDFMADKVVAHDKARDTKPDRKTAREERKRH